MPEWVVNCPVYQLFYSTADGLLLLTGTRSTRKQDYYLWTKKGPEETARIPNNWKRTYKAQAMGSHKLVGASKVIYDIRITQDNHKPPSEAIAR